MKKIALAALLLSACGQQSPAEWATWHSTVYDVSVTWRLVAPGSLGRIHGSSLVKLGQAQWPPTSTTCLVDMDVSVGRREVVRLAAHEWAHCAQMRHTIPGIPRPDLGEYYAGGQEGFAETYAMAYRRACGDDLRGLGWPDPLYDRDSGPACVPPDPRSLGEYEAP